MLLALCLLLSVQAPGGIRPGHPALHGMAPRIGVDTADDYVVNAGQRQPSGGTTRSVTRVNLHGEAVYVIASTTWGGSGDTTVTTMTVRAADFSLITQRLHASADSASLAIVDRHLTAWSVLPGEAPVLVDRVIDHPVFGIEIQLPGSFRCCRYGTGIVRRSPTSRPGPRGKNSIA